MARVEVDIDGSLSAHPGCLVGLSHQAEYWD